MRVQHETAEYERVNEEARVRGSIRARHATKRRTGSLVQSKTDRENYELAPITRIKFRRYGDYQAAVIIAALERHGPDCCAVSFDSFEERWAADGNSLCLATYSIIASTQEADNLSISGRKHTRFAKRERRFTLVQAV